MQKSTFFLHFFVYLGRLCHKKSGPRLGFPPLNYTPYTNYSEQNYTLKGIFSCRTIHFIPNRVQKCSIFLIYKFLGEYFQFSQVFVTKVARGRSLSFATKIIRPQVGGELSLSHYFYARKLPRKNRASARASRCSV